MDPMSLLAAVNAFYDQAFNKLMAATLGLVGLIGIAVPLIVGWVQTRSLRSEKNSLLSELRKELEAEREQLQSSANQEVANRIRAFEEKANKRFEEVAKSITIAQSAAEGRTFHVQANFSMQKGLAGVALEDYVTAVQLYMAAKDQMNIQRCIEQVHAACLPACKKLDFDLCNVEKYVSELITTLTDNNSESRYTNSIQKIERELREAKERKNREERDKSVPAPTNGKNGNTAEVPR